MLEQVVALIFACRRFAVRIVRNRTVGIYVGSLYFDLIGLLLFFFLVVRFAEERAITAERKSAERKQLAVFATLAEYFRSESDRKFLDGKAENFSRRIVPQLVNKHHYQQYCKR